MYRPVGVDGEERDSPCFSPGTETNKDFRACVAIVRDHYLFLLKQECEDRVRFAINSARVYPLLQLHYYIQIPT